jgi:uncharacterized protein YecE (DUF72 family)
MIHWYLGTIGYSYKDWLGSFYPPGTSQRRYLSYYSKIFNSVEIDTTFHSIPQPASVIAWLNSTPPYFKFCLKTPQQITHVLKLSSAHGPMQEFLVAIHGLHEKLGPILLQLPPNFTQGNLSIVDDFLSTLPPEYRFAMEFRHPSWYNDRTIELLSKYGICWVANDFPGLPRDIIQTTDFLFLRWIGVNGMYQHHSYERVDKADELKYWMDKILPIAQQVKAVYGFFNNDYAGFAAGTCIRFKQIAGLDIKVDELPHQERLF